MRRFNVCDLNAIETRVGAWVAGCQSLLDVFHKDKDPYLDLAVKLTQISYDRLSEDIKSKIAAIKAAAKRHRQLGKVGTLGAIYRMGGGDLIKDPKTGDLVKTGLWGFAESMGIEMTREEAHLIVKVFRESYNEIPECWYKLEGVVKDVLQPGTTKVVRYIGPNDCIKFDKLTILNRDPLLRIHLPGGGKLHYMDASIQPARMPWKIQDEEGNNTVDVYKPTLCYSGINQTTKQWSTITSHGGKLFENVVQKIARDVIAEKLLLIEEAGIEIDAHVHDEGIGETDDDPFAPGAHEMEEIMGLPIDWAPGLPLKAEGFESSFYRK